jgi:hypothetical protein
MEILDSTWPNALFNSKSSNTPCGKQSGQSGREGAAFHHSPCTQEEEKQQQKEDGEQEGKDEEEQQQPTSTSSRSTKNISATGRNSTQAGFAKSAAVRTA